MILIPAVCQLLFRIRNRIPALCDLILGRIQALLIAVKGCLGGIQCTLSGRDLCRSRTEACRRLDFRLFNIRIGNTALLQLRFCCGYRCLYAGFLNLKAVQGRYVVIIAVQHIFLLLIAVCGLLQYCIPLFLGQSIPSCFIRNPQALYINTKSSQRSRGCCIVRTFQSTGSGRL